MKSLLKKKEFEKKSYWEKVIKGLNPYEFVALVQAIYEITKKFNKEMPKKKKRRVFK